MRDPLHTSDEDMLLIKSLEAKITRLKQVQINVQHSITELVNVNSQLNGEIEELEKLADSI